MIPTGLSSLLPFLTIPIFTRILSPEDYGILSLVMIYAVFMCGLANFGMSLAFERNYFQYKNNPEKLAQLFYSSIVFVMINFAVLAGLTYLIKGKVSVFLTDTTQYDILILTAFAATFFFTTANNFYFTYFKNEERATTHTKYTILSSVLYFTLSLFFVVYLKIGIMGIVIAQLITGVSLFMILLYSFLKRMPFLFNINIMLESIKISYPLTPRIFIGVINNHFDKYMISLLVSLGGVGVYDIGKKISYQAFTFMTILQNVFNPQVYQRMFSKNTQDGKSIGRYLTIFLYASIFVSSILFYTNVTQCHLFWGGRVGSRVHYC